MSFRRARASVTVSQKGFPGDICGLDGGVPKYCSDNWGFVGGGADVPKIELSQPFGFWGGSCTVDALGNIQHQQENFKKIIKTVEV